MNTSQQYSNKTDKNYIDLLDEDKPISGQKFVCMSFISPEDIIKQRELYNFEAFLKQWDMSTSLKKFNQFMMFIAYKYGLTFESLSKDLEEFCKEEKDNLFTFTIEDDYKSFMDLNEKNLQESFNSIHKFKTNVRGVKVRGSFSTLEEAELRCKLLSEADRNHDVVVGEVGMWLPFHPEAYKTGRVEYLETDLNQLMHEKDKNQKKADAEFDSRLRESKEKAIADNIKKSLESGNVLTQTINKDGSLVFVKDMNTTEFGLNENCSLSEIRKQLFEGDNVVIDKNSDHGLSRLQ